MPAKLKPHFLHLAFALFLFSTFHSFNVIGAIISLYGKSFICEYPLRLGGPL